ncbi:hypothetical protein [Actinoplanes sp. NPDC020271]|uniref:hypothetical protein n=1 Tax=Actinoplanes sp. NPDC020271 TaxID=3363896 RepID=UPI0037A61DC2
MSIPYRRRPDGSLPGTNVPAGSDAHPVSVGMVTLGRPPTFDAVPPGGTARTSAPAQPACQ